MATILGGTNLKVFFKFPDPFRFHWHITFDFHWLFMYFELIQYFFDEDVYVTSPLF